MSWLAARAHCPPISAAIINITQHPFTSSLFPPNIPPFTRLIPKNSCTAWGFQPPACPPHTLHLVPPALSPMVPVLQPAKVRSPFVVYNSHTLCSWTVARLATLEHHRRRKQLTPLFRWWCSLWPGLAARRLLSVHDSVGDYRLHLLIS